MQGTMWLFPDSREWGLGTREPRAGSLHYALAPPVQGWVASAYILSCAPLLVRGERATQWRGGIAEGTPEIESRKPTAGSREPTANRRKPKASTVPLTHCLKT
jgi:hypothetical protein